MKASRLILYCLVMVAFGCLDPYDPPNGNRQTDFLVIEGHINSTTNSALVRITRSLDLDEEGAFPEVSGANVNIEYNNNIRIPMKFATDGTYKVNYPFDPSIQYRLRVVISGRGYLSDYITIEKNAPLQSIEWNVDSERFEVYANTSDSSPGSKYYRYTFEETFAYQAPFYSGYKFENGFPVNRGTDEEIYVCYLTSSSKGIIVATTENLSQNVINKQRIIRIPRGDKRLWKKYSILVRQEAISKAAYEYWRKISQTSESVGGLFDPIPYQITGNIRSLSNADEQVLGFFSAGNVSEMRILIETHKDLPPTYFGSFLGDCDESYVTVAEVSSLSILRILLTRAEYDGGPTIVGYYFTSPRCADCRLDGGTTEKPAFMN